MTNQPKKCASCWNGEIDSRPEPTTLYTVRDDDTGRLVIRGYLCREHAEMYADDGYTVRSR